jgi:hypothetical protein
MKLTSEKTNGRPIYLTDRGGRGVAIIAGAARVNLSPGEARALIQALAEMPSVVGDSDPPSAG